MPSSYRAVCSDFYVNSKLNVKMDLPSARETVMDFLERIRRDHPRLTRFKRYDGELALESSSRDEGRQRWMALRRTSVRAGVVNPETQEEAYALHRSVLTLCPFFLSITPLDVEALEVVFGFDLEASGNHHAIILDALLGESPMARLVDGVEDTPIDVSPFVGAGLSRKCDVQAFFEVKPRTSVREARSGKGREDAPISVYLTLRRVGALKDVRDLTKRFDDLVARGEALVETRVIPHLLTPLREAIASRRAQD